MWCTAGAKPSEGAKGATTPPRAVEPGLQDPTAAKAVTKPAAIMATGTPFKAVAEISVRS